MNQRTVNDMQAFLDKFWAILSGKSGTEYYSWGMKHLEYGWANSTYETIKS